MGYTSYSANVSSASASMGSAYAQSDAVWLMLGHGGTGFISTRNSSGVLSHVFVSTAGDPNWSCANSVGDTCLTSYTSTQMHRIRLMTFVGCHTGKALPNGDSLPMRAYSHLGVDSTVGFVNLIYFPQGTTWTDWFGSYLYYGYNVHDAAWAAANAVDSAYGGYGGFDSLWMYGTNVKTVPAAYGS
jgi:hypothetical protein